MGYADFPVDIPDTGGTDRIFSGVRLQLPIYQFMGFNFHGYIPSSGICTDDGGILFPVFQDLQPVPVSNLPDRRGKGSKRPAGKDYGMDL